MNVISCPSHAVKTWIRACATAMHLSTELYFKLQDVISTASESEIFHPTTKSSFKIFSLKLQAARNFEIRLWMSF